jgi:PKD repeat protein
VTAGQQVTVKANHAGSYGGRVITGYQWQITGGGTLATLSASTGETATLTTSSAGTVTVALIVTDSAGATGSASSTVSVQAAPVVTPTPAPAPSSGGGGAMSGAWVALLGVAAFALRRVRPA